MTSKVEAAPSPGSITDEIEDGEEREENVKVEKEEKENVEDKKEEVVEDEERRRSVKTGEDGLQRHLESRSSNPSPPIQLDSYTIQSAVSELFGKCAARDFARCG